MSLSRTRHLPLYCPIQAAKCSPEMLFHVELGLWKVCKYCGSKVCALAHTMSFMVQVRVCNCAYTLIVHSLNVDYICTVKCLGDSSPILVPCYKWRERTCFLENSRKGTKKYVGQMNVKGHLQLVQCSQRGYSKVASLSQNTHTGCMGFIQFFLAFFFFFTKVLI